MQELSALMFNEIDEHEPRSLLAPALFENQLKFQRERGNEKSENLFSVCDVILTRQTTENVKSSKICYFTFWDI